MVERRGRRRLEVRGNKLVRIFGAVFEVSIFFLFPYVCAFTAEILNGFGFRAEIRI
jgi:hypothetical protein